MHIILVIYCFHTIAVTLTVRQYYGLPDIDGLANKKTKEQITAPNCSRRRESCERRLLPHTQNGVMI